MTLENPIISKPVSEVVQTTQQTPAKPANPLAVVHSLLRGRYLLAIGLAMLGAAIGAPLGYFLVLPEFRSTGVVEVRATLPRILYETEQNERIPDFGPFLLTQVELLRSSRVVGLALQDPNWRALGRGLLPYQVAKFNESLGVSSPTNSQLIYVGFSDADANAAATAVRALIKAYEQVFVDLEIGTGTPLVNALENLKRQQAADLKGISDRMQALAGEFDSASLQQIYDTKLKMWLEAEVELRRAQVRASLWGHALASNPAGRGELASTQPTEQLLESVRRADPWLRDLERERANADRELRGYMLKFGDNHPKVAESQNRLQLFDQDITRRSDELRRLMTTTPPQPMAIPSAGGGEMTATGDPRIAEEIWRKTSAACKVELDGLAEKKRQVESLRYEERAARDLLEATKTRMLQLNVEGGKGSGRLSILSYGDVPLAPEKDRRMALTALGGIGLAGLGVGSVLLRSFLDRRMRHVDSTRQTLRSTHRLLGVLPLMPNEVIDPAKADAAAFCVHHIRAMLQIRQRITGHRLIGVTSPSPGDGKTTLVISLGISLAATGCRTLLVDCDFDGGGLSSRMRRLTRASAATQASGTSAESSAAWSGGLRDALGGMLPERVILQTGYANLSLLPLDMSPASSANQLSPTTLHQLFARLAASYDTILIDTGPILGSVEASIVAAEVDSTILVVARNGDHADAAAAMEKLTATAADVEGIVFNRALDADVARSVFRSSTSNRSIHRNIPDISP